MRVIIRFIGFLFATATIVFIVGISGVALVVWKFEQDLPDYTQLKNYEPAVMTRVHASDGSVLGEYAHERRLYLPASSIPPLVKEAFISAEDKNFYTHHGVDVEGIGRALLVLVEGGRHVQGASTITQQVAKNFLLTNERSFQRKIREALLSLRIEGAYSKEKILELYLNEIYLGLGNYGVAAASLNYFDKSVYELSIAEAAYLAALPKAPNNYNPFTRHERAVDRRNWVIDRMADNGYITRDAAEKAKLEPLAVTPRAPNAYTAGYFAEEVRRELLERYGEKKLYEGGLSVRTTLDPNSQVMARRALVDGLVRYDEAHGFRGPMRHIDIGDDWGIALGAVPALGDVAPWRLAVVLDGGAEGQLHIGLQPKRDVSGAVGPERETGYLVPVGLKWAKKPGEKNSLEPGDVVYVEPLDGKPGQYRLRQIPEVSGAIVVMDPFTGRVLAMVGGFSFDQSEFNRATQAWRQPGSSFKPIVYAAAIDNGYTPSTVELDEPIEIDQGPGLGLWKPENFEGSSSGPHTLRYGLEHSINQMTVRLARDIGMPLITAYAKKFGVYDDLPPYLSMALGSGETTLMRLTTAYSMLDNGGRRITATLIDRIQDRWGHTIYRHDKRVCDACDAAKWDNQEEPKIVDEREQVIDPLTAYQITSLMEGVIQFGTGQAIRAVGKHLAGKTGTTNDAKDLWFIGYSPDLTVGVFMGYDKPRSLGNSAQAALYTAPIFRDFMKLALADKPDVPFRVPPGIKLIAVDAKTGLRATGAGTILEAFKPGTQPPDSFIYGTDTTGTDSSGNPFGGAFNPNANSSAGTGTGGLY
ncbi:MAG: penicillin-binding protein 1A [Methylovirgula sp.]|jgi:penicillin-binding protein 1A